MKSPSFTPSLFKSALLSALSDPSRSAHEMFFEPLFQGEPGIGMRGEKGASGQKGEKGDRGHLGLPVSEPNPLC